LSLPHSWRPKWLVGLYLEIGAAQADVAKHKIREHRLRGSLTPASDALHKPIEQAA
jgi:hypothetical protein